MEIVTRCPHCRTRLSFDPTHCGDGGVICASCGNAAPFAPSPGIRNNNVVDVCPSCGKRAFYVQRDFNRKVGLLVVVGCGLAGLVFVAYDRPMAFYLCLLAGVVLDLALYALLPDITICYNCKAIFRGVTRNPEHGPFDLHIADHYEGRSQG